MPLFPHLSPFQFCLHELMPCISSFELVPRSFSDTSLALSSKFLYFTFPHIKPSPSSSHILPLAPSPSFSTFPLTPSPKQCHRPTLQSCSPFYHLPSSHQFMYIQTNQGDLAHLCLKPPYSISSLTPKPSPPSPPIHLCSVNSYDESSFTLEHSFPHTPTNSNHSSTTTSLIRSRILSSNTSC